jgi:hypothetical protein
MVRIVLNCEVHFPNINDKVGDIIRKELGKDLAIISDKLSDKAAKIIEKHNKLKVYKEAM